MAMMKDGWIRMQKSLREDPRVWRIARALRDRHAPRHDVVTLPVTQSVTPVTFYVTMVLGGLAALWMHADTFAGEDNCLSVTLAEINELTGIEGFAELLPRDWLEILDSEGVKLPGFQEHNGSIARTRALGAKRASRYRDRQRDASVTPSVTRVTPSREQTRLDQTRLKNTHTQRARAGEQRDGGLSEGQRHAEWLKVKAAYPPFAGRQDWIGPEKIASTLVDQELTTWAELLAGTERYAAYCAGGGVSAPRYVLTPAKFFGGVDSPWSQPWDVPTSAAGAGSRRLSAADYDAQSAERLQQAPGPDPGEL